MYNHCALYIFSSLYPFHIVIWILGYTAFLKVYSHNLDLIFLLQNSEIGTFYIDQN